MTLQELYLEIGGDYDQAMKVLRMDKLLDKHIRRFTQNGVMDGLIAAENTMDPAQLFKSAFSGIFTIFALAPWAYVGFESISHSAAEMKFPLKKTFRILAIAVITRAIAYVLLSLLAVTALHKGCSSWTDLRQPKPFVQ